MRRSRSSITLSKPYLAQVRSWDISSHENLNGDILGLNPIVERAQSSKLHRMAGRASSVGVPPDSARSKIVRRSAAAIALLGWYALLL